jgi:hypothetical protein
MVSVEAKACQTVYWNGSAVVAVDSGPGAFGVTLAAPALASQSEDTDYYLAGDAVIQACYRFYSATRGIYSAMSDPVTIFMDQPKLAKAHQSLYLSVYGGDSGLLVSGDIITLNGRTFKYIAAGGNVTIPAASAATVAAHAQAIADAINGDTANCGCTARAESAAVYIEANTAGASGNAITLSVTETGAHTDDLSVGGATLIGGGAATNEYLPQCKAVLSFPDNDDVVSSKVYADFAALFDTVDIFRTIDLGTLAGQQGAIFYHEQSVTLPANSGAWDSLTVSLGTSPDTALPLLDQYDPETDMIVSPPAAGTIARYQGVTLMAQALTDDDQYDILHSSLSHDSMEYFSTYNQRPGSSARGRPERFIVAGDSCFALHPSGFTHVYKSGAERPLQFVDTINGVGIDGKWAAHPMGNSVVMISAGLLRIMGGNDGNVSDVPGAGRLLADDWGSDVATYVSSGFDAVLNASLFLDSERNEILILWHGTGGLSLLEGANFRWMTTGPDIGDGRKTRVYLVTRRGRVVTADTVLAGTGTMQALAAGYTLCGSATGGSASTLVCAGATFHADMVGACVYCIDGDNAGDWAEVESVNVGTATLTFSAATAFDHAVSYGTRFAVSPVPVHLELCPLRTMDAAEPLVCFDRHKMSGAKLKMREISGLTVGVTDTIRLGAYRDDGSGIETETTEIAVSASGKDAAGAFEKPIDGLDVMPYLEYIGVGSSFEITDVEVSKDPCDSKQVE